MGQTSQVSPLVLGKIRRSPPMKFRFVAPALLAAAVMVLASSSAQAGLFGCNSCCAPSCCAPDVVWGSCCDSCAPVRCHRGLGLLSALKGICKSHSCCDPCAVSCCDPCASACEVSCGAPASCCSAPAEPSCGCAAAPACEPACGAPAACEPACGCAAPACDSCCEPACEPCCKPRRCGGLLRKLLSHKRCCAPACTVSCGCEASCGAVVTSSCGCN